MAVDGSFEELHAFAAGLGIPRHRFQGDHYDLPAVAARSRRRAQHGGGGHRETYFVRMAGPRGDRARAHGARKAGTVRPSP